MADDKSSTEGLGDPRPQVATTVPARKSATMAAEGSRGDTLPGATTTRHPASEVPADLADHARYEVLQLLGQGGMGAVYKARHKKMDRLVALKVINAKLLDNPKTVERFQREVQAAARLDHPNIVRAHDADEAGSTHFLVMEFVEGTDLARYVEKKGPLPVAHACHFIRQAALGLEHAHQHGMVHRDIKPHNLMLTLSNPGAHAPGSPVVKVMDFGLALVARETPSEAGLTGENALMGTADYIAPEQATDAHTADIRSDIYSLGCSLFHLLAGAPILAGANITQKLAAHLTGKLPLGDLPAGVPVELRAVLAKMVAKDPAERYQTPSEVAAALVPFIKKATPAAEGAGNLALVAGDKAAILQAPTVTPARQPAGTIDIFEAPMVAPEPRRSLPPTPRIQVPSGSATIGSRSDPKSQTVMGQGAAERQANLPGKKRRRKKAPRAWPLLVKALKAVILTCCFAGLVFGTLKLSIAVFRPKQPSGTMAADNGSNPTGATADNKAGPKGDESSTSAARKIYLSDLDEANLDEANWSGNDRSGFAKNGQSNVAAITVNGVRFRKGLWTHPPPNGYATVQYRLSGLGATTFVTQVAVNDSARPAAGALLTFQVLGDKKVLWTSAPMRATGQMQECRIGVKNIRILELRVYCPDKPAEPVPNRPAHHAAHAVWLDPYLTDSALDGNDRPASSAAPPIGDAWKQGSIWTGTGHQDPGGTFDVKITVLKRDGNDFDGRYEVFGGQNVVMIKGTVSQTGAVAWKFMGASRIEKAAVNLEGAKFEGLISGETASVPYTWANHPGPGLTATGKLELKLQRD